MNDISSTGLQIQVTASVTFPNGFTVTEFADDADAIDAPGIELAATGMGPNGDMTKWSKPQAVPFSTNVIPNTEGDLNMNVLSEANRVARGKTSARDVISIVATYPSGMVITLSRGVINNAPPVLSSTAEGRFKTRMYGFVFEQVSIVRPS